MDIKQIKLGNSTYDIKDQIARNGFSTAGIVLTTDQNVEDGELSFSKLVFYDSTDTQNRNELGSVPLNGLTLPDLQTTQLIASETLYSPNYTILDSDNSLWSNISMDLESNKPVLYFRSTDTGAVTGNATTVKLPIGANGTIALTSDVSSVQNDVDAIKTLLNVESTDVQGTIDKYDEIVDFLDGLSETPTLVTQLAEKVYSVDYDESSTAPSLTYKKSSSGTATTVVTLDTTPTANSKKPVTSGGVKSALNTLEGLVTKKISLNGKEFSPSSGTVTLPNTVTKIQLNGKDQTLTTTASSGEGKVNLSGIVTNISFNGVAQTVTTNSTNGTGSVALQETDPVFTASPAHGITAAQITAWDTVSSGGLTNVSYTTSGSGNNTKHLLQKTVGASTTTYIVELPTATYDSTTEVLELVLAKAPA